MYLLLCLPYTHLGACTCTPLHLLRMLTVAAVLCRQAINILIHAVRLWLPMRIWQMTDVLTQISMVGVGACAGAPGRCVRSPCCTKLAGHSGFCSGPRAASEGRSNPRPSIESVQPEDQLRRTSSGNQPPLQCWFETVGFAASMTCLLSASEAVSVASASYSLASYCHVFKK